MGVTWPRHALQGHAGELRQAPEQAALGRVVAQQRRQLRDEPGRVGGEVALADCPFLLPENAPVRVEPVLRLVPVAARAKVRGEYLCVQSCLGSHVPAMLVILCADCVPVGRSLKSELSAPCQTIFGLRGTTFRPRTHIL